MKQQNINSAINAFKPYLSQSAVHSLKIHLEQCSDSCHSMLLKLRMKSKMTALLLSIFLGGWGIDRFYLGHTNLAKAKLISRVITLGLVILSHISGGFPIVAAVIINMANIGVGIWYFLDIFFVYKATSFKNYDIIISFLRKHKNQSTKKVSV